MEPARERVNARVVSIAKFFVSIQLQIAEKTSHLLGPKILFSLITPQRVGRQTITVLQLMERISTK
jgi:hypothetical protein